MNTFADFVLGLFDQMTLHIAETIWEVASILKREYILLPE